MSDPEQGTAIWWERLVLGIGVAVILAAPLAARLPLPTLILRVVPQEGAGDLPKFEVASVKANKSLANRVGITTLPGGRLDATNAPLRMLILFAYELQDFQLVGAPNWTTAERFDIIAKGEGDAASIAPGTVGRTQLMLQSLLAERFKLAVHRDKRELPIYSLVLARQDGRLGAQLRRSSIDCQAMTAAERDRANRAQDKPTCGFRVGPAPGQMAAGGFPLSKLAAILSGFVQRAVVDRTELAGSFDLDLTFGPDQATAGSKGGGAAGPSPPSDPDRPSLFTALQEQLGLKLDSGRGPVDVLVIDSVSQPTPD